MCQKRTYLILTSLQGRSTKIFSFIFGAFRFLLTFRTAITLDLFKTTTLLHITFHKKSGCEKVIWKANFKLAYRSELWTFLPENSDLLYSFSFYFCRSCQIHCFLHTVAAIPMSWPVWVVIWCKGVTQVQGVLCFFKTLEKQPCKQKTV